MAVTPEVPERQSACDSTAWGHNKRYLLGATEPGGHSVPGHEMDRPRACDEGTKQHQTGAQTLTEADDSLPTDSPPRLQSPGSFLQRQGPLGKGDLGVSYGGQADGERTHFVLAG